MRLTIMRGVFGGVALFAIGFAAPTAYAQQQTTSSDLTNVYCLACHDDTRQTGGLSLQGLDPANAPMNAEVWEKVVRRLRGGEMPPPGLRRPDVDVINAFASGLEEQLDREAIENPNPGRPETYRLNRTEYSNAIRDFLGLDIEAGDMLPADDTGYGFDNIADVLSVTPALLDRYLLAARRVSTMAIGDLDMVPVETRFERNRETGFMEAGYKRNVRNDLPLGAQEGTSIRFYFPLDAEYKITIDDGGELHELQTPVPAGMRTLVVAFYGENTRAEGGGGGGTTPPPMDIRLDGERVAQIYGHRGRIESITIDGPYNAQGPGNTPSRAKIFSCRPATDAEKAPCAYEILSRLARQAYRRPVNDSDVGSLMALYEMGDREGGFERGIERALQAMLVSPHFIFRVERDPDGARPGTAYQLSSLELASRLSFFLWSSLPDDELLTLAEQDRLRETEVLEQQVRRMLDDPRARALVDNFAGQWLYLRNMASVQREFPEFNAELRSAMQQETELFFEKILRENRSVLDLLDADYTFVNERLAQHYGIGNVYGPQFREVTLNGVPRRGLLGHASILTATSLPDRTSVVVRGNWLLENLLGAAPPAPPPDIPELEPETTEGRQLTLRQQMEAHRASVACASCHARMDPLGFALENYDAIGRWRTEDDAGHTIDASAELPGGTTFDGPAGLRQVMVTDFRDEFVENVAEKLLTYAVGRGIEFYDRPTLRDIRRRTAGNDHRMADMIIEIAKSTPFQMRRTPEQ